MKQVFILKAMLLAIILGFTGIAFADDSANSEEAIRAECQAASKGASYPEEFVEECVEEKKQALKEAAEDGKDAS